MQKKNIALQGMKTLAVKGIIFDVDGTLADSVGFFYELALEMLVLAGCPAVTREDVYALMRLGDAAPMEKLFPPDYPDPVGTFQRIAESRMDEWMERYHSQTQAIPGSIALLHELHARGLRLGIATSSGRELPFLDRWGVRHLFSGIVGREDVTRRKPHPEPVLKCLGHLCLDAREVMYIGDSPADIRAGKAAGSYTVGVLTGTSPHEVLCLEAPDYILDTVASLRSLLPE